MVDSEAVERAADGRDTGDGRDPGNAALVRATLTPELQAAIDALPDAFRQAVWLT